MTWYLDRSTGDVYEDDGAFSGKITTLNKTDYELERDLLPLMRDTWEAEANLGNSPVMNQRAGYILMDMATKNWEFGTPP